MLSSPFRRPTSPYARNMVWRLFTSPTMRERPQWEQLRALHSRSFARPTHAIPAIAGSRQLIEDLKQISPEFCQLVAPLTMCAARWMATRSSPIRPWETWSLST